MTPDRLRGWLRKRARGAVSLQCAAETLTGFAEVCTLDTDEIKLMGADPEDDIATNILEQCQEYTDGEAQPCKFAIAWIGKDGKPLRNCIHHCKPKEPDDELAIPKQIDATVIIRELLSTLVSERHAATKERVVMSEGYEHIVKLLSSQLTEMHKDRLALQGQLANVPEVAAAVVITDEQREESVQRAEAMKAFRELLDPAAQLVFALLSQKYLDPVDEVAAARAAKEAGA